MRNRTIMSKCTRFSEFMSSNFGIFHAGVEPDDIRQGSLADCWLQCSLSGLAEFPDLVEVKHI
jgi:hypothetical protein